MHATAVAFVPGTSCCMLPRALRPLCSFRFFASKAAIAFQGDETRVVRSPHADIPPIPDASIADIILKKSKLFTGQYPCTGTASSSSSILDLPPKLSFRSCIH